MYDKWVCHFHVGSRKTPLTVYQLGDINGAYEVWYGSRRYLYRHRKDAMAKLGEILARCSRISF